jgi:aspartyl-tRNA(Asn)/glutamyl-tRNA(Gln) amidotransferase subunit A
MSRALHERPLTELASDLRERRLSSRELVQHYLTRIRSFDDRFNAFVTVTEDEALALADETDRRLKAGERLPPLAGMPIGVKDSIPTAGMRTTANSRLLECWIPDEDAAGIRRLREAGAIVLGKTNLNEFGWALPAEGDLTPPARNPWNPAYAAIGSSSGSGAAVSAGFCAAAIGTDGGGSARLPAGQNGLVGIKPTHRRVSRLGMDDSSISEICPMTRTVADAALMLSIMAGYERDDWQSWPEPVPAYAAQLTADVRGWRIGIPRRDVEEAGLEPEVAAAFEAGLAALRRLGVELVDVVTPGLSDARAANFVILNAEAHAAHLPTLRATPEKYGRSALVYHWMGGFLTATDYLNAKQIGLRVRNLLETRFRDVRVLVTPTSPVVTAEAARRPESHRRGANAAFTSPFNLTGHPAISVPAGISASTGLPIGLQFVGPLFDEMTLFQIAHAYEAVVGPPDPPILGGDDRGAER